MDMENIMENITNTVEDIFEATKQGIREIMQTDVIEKVKKFVYKIDDVEYEFKMEQEDIQEMLPKLQAINLGLLDEVTVKDADGNEITLDKETYVKRNLAGFKHKANNEMDLDLLEGILDKVETFAEFVNFENFETAKEYYIPEPDVEEEEEEIVEEVIPEDLPMEE